MFTRQLPRKSLKRLKTAALISECLGIRSGAACEEPVNVASKRPYRGVNIIALWASAFARDYAYGLWGTYKQWQSVGAQVKKGESGTCVVLWKSIETPDHDEKEDREKDSTVCLAEDFRSLTSRR